MDKNMNNKEWYVAKSMGQGLICDQENGKSIAVSYDPDDARLIAAAPELLQFAQDIERYLLAGAIKTKSDRQYVIGRAIRLIEKATS